jgi:hypothetical protein
LPDGAKLHRSVEMLMKSGNSLKGRYKDGAKYVFVD